MSLVCIYCCCHEQLIVNSSDLRYCVDVVVVILQHGQSNLVIDNIHSIVAAAAVNFPPAQLDYFVALVQKVSSVTS